MIRGMPLMDFIEQHFFKHLTERERKVAMLRFKDCFGVGENTAILKEIALSEGVTPERIRQNMARARYKIRMATQRADRKLKNLQLDNTPPPVMPVRLKYIYELEGISPRVKNALANDGTIMVDELTGMKFSDLWKVPNLGMKSIKEIIVILEKHGLRLKFDPLHPELHR